MIRAKNYETVSKFVKVMPRIPWLLFSDTVYKIEVNGIDASMDRGWR